jgi:hypothetical protein
VLAQVVAQSLGAAQVFFLIALICGAIATVIALVRGNLELCVLAGCVTFSAVGLLFFA